MKLAHNHGQKMATIMNTTSCEAGQSWGTGIASLRPSVGVNQYPAGNDGTEGALTTPLTDQSQPPQDQAQMTPKQRHF